MTNSCTLYQRTSDGVVNKNVSFLLRSIPDTPCFQYELCPGEYNERNVEIWMNFIDYGEYLNFNHIYE